MYLLFIKIKILSFEILKKQIFINIELVKNRNVFIITIKIYLS